MDFNNIEFDNLFNVINQIFLIPDCLDKTQFKFHLINNITHTHTELHEMMAAPSFHFRSVL